MYNIKALLSLAKMDKIYNWGEEEVFIVNGNISRDILGFIVFMSDSLVIASYSKVKKTSDLHLSLYSKTNFHLITL